MSGFAVENLDDEFWVELKAYENVRICHIIRIAEELVRRLLEKI